MGFIKEGNSLLIYVYYQHLKEDTAPQTRRVNE
jgi:hypothetical protein